MFERMPNRVECATFAVLALVCACVVTIVPRHDYAMMFATMPLFFICSVMGLRSAERRRPRG